MQYGACPDKDADSNGLPADHHATAAPPIRLLIVDDHFWIREGVRYAVHTAGIEVVGEATTGGEALRMALQDRHDVLLLDVSMPEFDGFEVLERLKSARPDMRILLFSSHDRPELLARAERLGAGGFLSKGADRQALIDAIRKVGGGGSLWTEKPPNEETGQSGGGKE